jgi:4-amino-4-deoxy-L-arabinose transferase and related glycosyltransferases of PMT family
MTPENTKTKDQKPKTKNQIIWLLFAAVIIAVYFFGLSMPLVGPDEPRYSQVAREMFERGDWVTPTLGGFDWFEKPALLYWLQIAAYNVFGVTEFAARFGSALFGLATVFSLWILGRFSDRWSVAGDQWSVGGGRWSDKEVNAKDQRPKTKDQRPKNHLPKLARADRRFVDRVDRFFARCEFRHYFDLSGNRFSGRIFHLGNLPQKARRKGGQESFLNGFCGLCGFDLFLFFHRRRFDRKGFGRRGFSAGDRRLLLSSAKKTAAEKFSHKFALGRSFKSARRLQLVSADVSEKRLEIHRRIYYPASFPALYFEQIPASAAVLFFPLGAPADDHSVAAVFLRRRF